MDSGHVIPGLNESWSLLGAKLNEWMCGFGVFILLSTAFDKPTKVVPLLLLAMVGTTVGLAIIRRRFPDEEKGMRNFCFMLLGIQPPGIPAPSAMQPVWSGCPLRTLPAECDFMQLGLPEVFKSEEEEQLD
ncbi:MAG: hypothetical protein K1X83_15055 [Oligoflexia bacterium]|nr:hypothetical protein [Oligoflexia bacterium]